MFARDKMEAKLHLYIGGIVEAMLDDTPCHPSRTLTGKGVGNDQASP